MKTKTIRTIAFDASGSVVFSGTAHGLKNERASLWEAADALRKAGHQTGEIHQNQVGAKAFAVYAWKRGTNYLPIIRYDPVLQDPSPDLVLQHSA